MMRLPRPCQRGRDNKVALTGMLTGDAFPNLRVNITDSAFMDMFSLAPVAPALWWGVFLAFALLVLGKCMNFATAPLPPDSMLAMFMKGRSQPTRLANVHND